MGARTGRIWFVVCVIATLSVLSAQRPLNDFARADAAIVRFDPSAFPELPPPIRDGLNRRSCTVPQPADERTRNVVSGRLITPGRVDWAVLCSRERQSVILVFNGTSAARIAELDAEPDLNYLQVVDGAGTISYSRVLAVATPKVVRQRARNDGRHQLRQIDRDGIEDAFVGKSSQIWYWSGRRWLRLVGAD
jgi:hypothetical protein